MLSLHKWKTGIELASMLDVPFLLLIKYPMKTIFKDLRHSIGTTYGFGRMNNPRDWQDQEPMAFIPMQDFKPLVNPKIEI